MAGRCLYSTSIECCIYEKLIFGPWDQETTICTEWKWLFLCARKQSKLVPPICLVRSILLLQRKTSNQYGRNSLIFFSVSVFEWKTKEHCWKKKEKKKQCLFVILTTLKKDVQSITKVSMFIQSPSHSLKKESTLFSVDFRLLTFTGSTVVSVISVFQLTASMSDQ